MSFGESKYPFGSQNPFEPLKGLGSKLGSIMDARRDQKNKQIEAEGKGSELALATHLGLEAGMIDREHMVHVFGEQLKPHMKPGTGITYSSGPHSIAGTWAGGDEPADGEGDGAEKPADGAAKPAANKPAKPRAPRTKAPIVLLHKDANGKVTGTSEQIFPAPVNVKSTANGKPQATSTKPGVAKPAATGATGKGKPTAAPKPTATKPAAAKSSTSKPSAAKPKNPAASKK